VTIVKLPGASIFSRWVKSSRPAGTRSKHATRPQPYGSGVPVGLDDSPLPTRLLRPWLTAAALCLAACPLVAQAADEAKPVYPIAVFAFQERGPDTQGLGQQVTDLLFAGLAADSELFLVDREDLKKVLDELELNRSGLVKPDEAVQVGHLTGAKVLVTGSVLQAGNSLYLVAKIIGTETSRVLGESAKGNVKDELDQLVEQLAGQVAKTVKQRVGELVAKPVTREDRLAALQEKTGKGRRPTVCVEITERHVGQPTIDPAAETEVALFCRELGFEVIDPDDGRKSEADVLLTGEAFSEFASRHGNLISVKARLELKAVDRQTARLLAIDRQTAVAVDLTEQLAGKTALQEAAASLAERLLPKLVKPEPEKKAAPAKRKRAD
jgi:TolB-like protein